MEAVRVRDNILNARFACTRVASTTPTIRPPQLPVVVHNKLAFFNSTPVTLPSFAEVDLIPKNYAVVKTFGHSSNISAILFADKQLFAYLVDGRIIKIPDILQDIGKMRFIGDIVIFPSIPSIVTTAIPKDSETTSIQLSNLWIVYVSGRWAVTSQKGSAFRPVKSGRLGHQKSIFFLAICLHNFRMLSF
jgi:hypothetical protein